MPSSIFTNLYEVGFLNISVLQRRKLLLTEVKNLTHVPKAESDSQEETQPRLEPVSL